MSSAISQEGFERAQEAEITEWEKRASDPGHIKYELSEHSDLADPVKTLLPDRRFDKGLDLGVGCWSLGFLSPNLSDRIDHIDGLDPLPKMELSVPDPDLQAKIDEIRGRVNYIHSQGESVPADENTYDIVACINVIDHAQDPVQILSEIRRVLKPGGILCFGVSTLSALGYQLWKIRRRRNPEAFLFRAHPHIYHWKDMRTLLRSILPGDTLWSNRPSFTEQVIGHGRMSFWLIQLDG